MVNDQVIDIVSDSVVALLVIVDVFRLSTTRTLEEIVARTVRLTYIVLISMTQACRLRLPGVELPCTHRYSGQQKAIAVGETVAVSIDHRWA